MTECQKCHYTSGNDWSQCGGRCAMPGSPCYDATWAQDFELLQNAARAVGGEARTNFAGAVQFYRDGEYEKFWNPLRDDGDALRLAVALQAARGASWVICLSIGDNRTACEFLYASGADVLANTRRAIVMAAADYGKQIKGNHT